MEIKIPTYNGRKMELIKAYPNFILFQDKKTKVNMCFSYNELTKNNEEILTEEELKQYRRRPGGNGRKNSLN